VAAPDAATQLVHVSARADYAVRAALELAAGAPLNAATIATRQRIPRPFLEKILHDLRDAQIVVSQRGRDGGHRLAAPPAQITIAEVLRAVERPLDDVRGRSRAEARYEGPAARVHDLWTVLRISVRTVLEDVTLADLLDIQWKADRVT
jgi:Rrf2 family protein